MGKRKILTRFANFDIGSISQVSSAIDQIKQFARVNKKARKNLFFRNKVFNLKTQFGNKSQKIIIDNKYEKEAKNVKHHLGLDALNDVLGNKTSNLKILADNPDNGTVKNWSKRWDAKHKLEKIQESEDIIKKGFRKFSKTSPEKKSMNILKRGLSRRQVANAYEGSGKIQANQSNRMNFEREGTSALNDLKRTRKQMALDIFKNKKKSSKSLHTDISMRGKTQVRFIRRNGRIIPIRSKKK